MKVIGYKMIPVSELRVTFFVRQHLQQDRVLFFAELYEAGVNVDPPTVRRKDGCWEVLDGRKRRAGFDLWDETAQMRCRVVECSDQEAVMLAFMANFTDNPKVPEPPTRKDIIEGLVLMLELKIPVGEIRKLLPYNKVLNKRLTDDAQSRYWEKRLSEAVRLYRQGKPFETIEQLTGIKSQDVMKQVNKETKKPTGLSQLKGTITKEVRKASTRVCSTLRRLRECYVTGEATAVQTLSVLDHAKKAFGEGEKIVREEANRCSMTVRQKE